MRIAVISDIHSNLIAYTKIIENIRKQNVDQVICLGDCVTDGPESNKIVELVKRDCNFCIKGNREAYIKNASNYDKELTQYKNVVLTEKNLTEENKKYISLLDEYRIIEVDQFKILFIHGKEYDETKDYKKFYQKICQKYNFDICCFGHTHVQSIDKHNERLFVNPGSCGLPADGHYYRYFILDIEENRYRIEKEKISVNDTLNEVYEYLTSSKEYKDLEVWYNLMLLGLNDGCDYLENFVEQYLENIKESDSIQQKNDKFNELYGELYSSKFIKFKTDLKKQNS